MEALLELQALTGRLRRDCPWDREQTARSGHVLDNDLLAERRGEQQAIAA